MNRGDGLNRHGFGLTPVGVVLVLIDLFPVYWMASTSLNTDEAIYANPPQIFPSSIQWENVQEAVLANPPVLRAIRSSAIICLGTMLLTLEMAAPAADALARLRLRNGAIILLYACGEGRALSARCGATGANTTMRLIQVGVGSFGRSRATLVRGTEEVDLVAVVESIERGETVRR